MTKRDLVYIEFYSPWLCGGYSTSNVPSSNDLFQAVALLISEENGVYNMALGESKGQYLHQIRLPKSCVKTFIQLPKPVDPEMLKN